MTIVLLMGRKLPHQDFEGDDFVLGSGGKWVTCTDTSAGRMVAYATNGRVNVNGQQIRAAIKPRDPDGVTLPQAQQGVRSLTGRKLIIPPEWDWAEVVAHLRARKGLVIQGWYSKIARDYRFQLSANFGHAMWISHYSSTAGMRVWDPLDPNRTHHGSWVPARYIRASMEELARHMNVSTSRLYCGYVPLEPL
jgi:hypothetical protein